MKILHVISGLDTGGTELFLERLLQRLDRKEFSHAVVSLRTRGSVGSRLMEAGVPVYALEAGVNFAGLRAPFALRGIVRREAPDLIQGWMYHGNLAAWAASRWASDAALLWGIRQSLYDLSREKPLTRMVIRANVRLSRRPRWILYNSATSARQHEAAGYRADKTHLISNGFDCGAFHPDAGARLSVRAELGLDRDSPLIGRMARYHPMKDHANFLQAAAQVATRWPQAHFLMAGAGVDPDNTELMTQVRDLGLVGHVHLLGARRDMPRLNASLDVACSSSWAEAFPNVLGEAMACEVPCVTTDVGDSAVIVADTGQIVAPRDPQALAAGIARVLELAPAERRDLGARAGERVRRLFSMEVVSGQYRSLYEQLMPDKLQSRR